MFTDPKNVARLIGTDAVVKDAHNNICRGKIVKVHNYRSCIVIA